MAPEQVCGGALDHRADLFSLGSVLYYMCTGELPFAAPNAVAVLHRVTEDQPRPVSECNEHVPAWLADLIGSLHAKDPGRRLQSATEVKDRLIARDGAPSVTHAMRPQSADTAGQSHGHRRPGFTLLLGAIFLLSLPVFYFLLPKGNSATREERQPPLAETKRRPVAAEDPPRPAPPQHREVVKVAPQQPTPQPPRPTKEKKKPKRPAARSRGIVVVQVYDQTSQIFFRTEGLSARHLKTSEVIPLQQGRNELATGIYRLELPRSPDGIIISPRQFTVSTEKSALISIARTVPSGSPLAPPEGVGLPPDLSPPPPPPPPGPPRPRR
jgi:hypothetical protein